MLFRQAVAVAIAATAFCGANAAATVMVPNTACNVGPCAGAALRENGGSASGNRLLPAAAPAPQRSIVSGNAALAALLGLLVLAFRFVPRRSALPEVAS
jgi:hypothetical protein